jgi:hypothetical protein
MTLESRIGKLAEIRFRPPLDKEELTDFTIAVRELVRGAEEPLVFCTDLRLMDGMEKETSDTLVWLMRRDNPMVRANAVLIAPRKPALSEIAEQMVKESNNPGRRVFRDKATLIEYLTPMLTAPEQQRLEAFLCEGAAR